MQSWNRQWKQYRIMLLALGIVACIAIAITAHTYRAQGGIFAIASAVLFDTYLGDAEGWMINLHAGGYEGFGMTGYYCCTYNFLCGIALVGLAGALLFVKPGKGTLACGFALQAVVIGLLTASAIGTFRVYPVIVAVAGWGLLGYGAVLVRRYWKAAVA